MSPLRFFLLGAPRVERDGEPISIPRRKAIALLAYLAVTRRPHSRDALATLLWPEHDQSGARANLRRDLSSLKQALGDEILVVEPMQVGLDPQADVWLDVDDFRARVAASKPHDHAPGHLCAGCLAALTEAAALYGGGFMEGFSLPDSPGFDEWQFFEAESLRQTLASALQQLVEWHAGKGEYGQGIEFARRWLALDPLHEPAHRQLMRLYAWSGQQAAALRQYQECAHLLDEELGAPPDEETTALYEAIRTRQLAPPDTMGEGRPFESMADRAAAREVPVTRAAPSVARAMGQEIRPSTEQAPVRHNLPAQPMPLVGREKELADLRRLLVHNPACRLVTLVGPGGIGKTRLAVAAAEEQLSRLRSAPEIGLLFPDGVYFASLAPLSTGEQMVPAIANTLGFSFYSAKPPREQLLDYVRPKRMLLVLDNLEHLLNDEGVRLVTDILAMAPHLKLLVTSRVRLNVQGEQVYPVAELSVPEAEITVGGPERDEQGLVVGAETYSAVQLFQQSAWRVRPDFRLTANNLPAVIRICQLVQGMPLGIVLAVPWLVVLPADEIAAEIQRGLDFLRTDMHDLPERQRSLRSVFDASWKLLTDQERAALLGLAVFQGGSTREAAQDVAGASLETLLALVNKSWLQPEAGGRYQLHELLRQYAAEKLQSDPVSWQQCRQRHSAYFAERLRQLDRQMRGTQPEVAFAAVTADFANIRAAWSWLVEQGRFDTVVEQMLPALYRYGEGRLQALALQPLLATAQQAVANADPTTANQRYRAILLTAQAAFLKTGTPVRSLILEVATPAYEDAIRQAWSIAGASDNLLAMGLWGALLIFIYGWIFDEEEGLRHLRQLLLPLRQAGQRWELAFALQNLGRLIYTRLPDEAPDQRLAEALQHLTEALALFQELRDELESGYTLRLLGVVRMMQRHFPEARDHLLAAQAKLEACGDQANAASINWLLADIHLRLGEYETAFGYLRRMRQAYADRSLQSDALSRESYEALRYSTIDHAKETREQTLALVREAGDDFSLAWSTWEMGEIYRVAGDYLTARQWYEQARVLFEKAQDKSGNIFYHRGLGDIAHALGDYGESQRQFQASLNATQQIKHEWGAAYALAGLGRASLALGEHELAHRHFLEALRKAYKIGDGGILMFVMTGIAGLYATCGQEERAVELCALVAHEPMSWRETKEQAAAVQATAAAALPPERLSAARERSHGSDIWKTAERIRQEMSSSTFWSASHVAGFTSETT